MFDHDAAVDDDIQSRSSSNGGAAANDLLCKITSALRNQYPGIKAVAIDWSAWGGVGMATRGNIPTLMKMAGIDLVPFEQAAPMVRAELLASHPERPPVLLLDDIFAELDGPRRQRLANLLPRNGQSFLCSPHRADLPFEVDRTFLLEPGRLREMA